jgi:hypothetical protein
MTAWGPIQLYSQKMFVLASDVTLGVLDLFCTPNYGASGRQHGPSPGSPYMYEEWQVLGAVACLLTPTAGTREGCKVRIEAISGDGGGASGALAFDLILSDTVQRHFHYASFVGPLVLPYGLYAEVDKGGFEASDLFCFAVNYRKAIVT